MRFIYFILLSLFTTTTFAQHAEVKWMTITEAEALNKITPKPIIIDVYTDWCGWCKRMDATTYSDPQVVEFLNTHFYPVKFNAETKDTILYQGVKYTSSNPASSRSSHQLAEKLMPGSRSYPTSFFMDETMQVNLIVPGYLDAKDIAPFLVFYKEKIYSDANINDYRDLFKAAFEPDTIKKPSVNWKPLNGALAQNIKTKKKIFVFVEDDATISTKVMDGTNFKDSTVVSYLNKNFINAKFNSRFADTITINNQALINNPADGPYHQLILAAMKENIKFPACFIFDENNFLITPIPQYMTPQFMMPVLIFFNEDKYKEMQFPDFLAKYQSQGAK